MNNLGREALARFIRLLIAFGNRLPTYDNGMAEVLDDHQTRLEVRSSLIDGAGEGLFTNQLIQKEELVCRYHGTRKTFCDVLRTKDRDYVYMVNWNSYVDPGPHPNVVARYVNHHFESERRNVTFSIRDDGVFWKATRDIQPGEELYGDYGCFYWQTIGWKDYQRIKRESQESPFRNDD